MQNFSDLMQEKHFLSLGLNGGVRRDSGNTAPYRTQDCTERPLRSGAVNPNHSFNPKPNFNTNSNRPVRSDAVFRRTGMGGGRKDMRFSMKN